uniref:Uncharacterized protein n=1 Tax=Lepeophtheirus salmonis TaxID=72036 RepID=A0A0K2SYQ8_LEPSM
MYVTEKDFMNERTGTNSFRNQRRRLKADSIPTIFSDVLGFQKVPEGPTKLDSSAIRFERDKSRLNNQIRQFLK